MEFFIKEKCEYCTDTNNLSVVEKFTICEKCKEKYHRRTIKCSLKCCVENNCDASCCKRE